MLCVICVKVSNLEITKHVEYICKFIMLVGVAGHMLSFAVGSQCVCLLICSNLHTKLSSAPEGC